MKGGLFEKMLRADFEEFLAIYPRKRACERAWKPYVLARKIVDKETLHGAAARFAEQSKNEEVRFIQYPCNWLRDHCWRDIVEEETIPEQSDPNLQWRCRVRGYKHNNFWQDFWGEKPDDPRCAAPVEVLSEFGFRAMH